MTRPLWYSLWPSSEPRIVYGSPEDLIGTVLGGTYELERVVGEGTYGTVYAAMHKRLNKAFAVKVLRAHDSDAFTRFCQEAQIAGSLGSRFIAQVSDFNSMEDGTPYLVMELLTGEDLGTRLAKRKVLALTDVLEIAEQASMALSVAHRHQIVHRDLKPQNIFICTTEDEGEVVKLIDFGISKILTKTGSTAAGQFIGTPLYMSPEQVRGQQELIDARSDVYGLAAVLYEALAGHAVYDGRSIFELVEKINGPAMPPPLSEMNPSIPRAVDDVLLRALAKSRDDRPASITDFFNELRNSIRANTENESRTPAAAIMGTHALETMCATGMVATPLWRGRTGRPDELRFVAPDGGFYGGDNRNRTLKLRPDRTEFHIGSVPTIGDIDNDLVLPSQQVSRNAARITVRDGRPYLRREQRCTVPVRVGLSLLEKLDERPLHHGQPLAIGIVAGVFHDGRYVPTQVPAQAVDEQTGLLGREGLAWEAALAARIADDRRLIIIMPTGEAAGDQSAACRAALALHQQWPAAPIARFRHFVGVLAKPDLELSPLADCATAAAGVGMLLGHLAVGDSSDEAGVRIDEAVGSMERLTATGSNTGPVDLSEHRLALYDIERFQREGHRILETGGGVGLLALDEQEQLKQLGSAVFGALELELLQVAGRVAGARTMFCKPAPGAVAFASADAAEQIARQIASEWHSRGPVRGDVLEVERGVTIDVVHADELAALTHHATHLATGRGLGGGVEGLPLPLAIAAQRALNSSTPRDRAQALVDVVSCTWRFLAIALGAMADAARPTAPTAPTAQMSTTELQPFGEPWRSRAIGAASALMDTPGRVGELARALFVSAAGETGAATGPVAVLPRRAIQVADEMAAAMTATLVGGSGGVAGATGALDIPALTDAVGDLLLALRPLRGWTLASVVRVDRLDVFGDCETVHYIDYTGTYAQGTHRQATLIKDLRMGPFVYLTRLAEGIVVPLEPHLRRRSCPETGMEELYWAENLVTAPGAHGYRSLVHGYVLEDAVSEKQIPRSMRQ